MAKSPTSQRSTGRVGSSSQYSPSLQRQIDGTKTPDPRNLPDVSPSLRQQIDQSVANTPGITPGNGK